MVTLSKTRAEIDPDPLCRWCGLALLVLKEIEVRDDGVVFLAYECFCCRRRTTFVHS